MATDVKKEQERDELHRSIWNIANDLRGAVDGWDFKQYVLGIMFYRYISENLKEQLSKINNTMYSIYDNFPVSPPSVKLYPFSLSFEW